MAARAAGSEPQWAVPRARRCPSACCTPSRCGGGCAPSSAARPWSQSDDAVLLFEPGRYPVAYFPIGRLRRGCTRGRPTTAPSTPSSARPPGSRSRRRRAHAARGAWQHVALPEHAAILDGKVALAWRAMDAFYEEDERILGHAADPYHRIDIRHSVAPPRRPRRRPRRRRHHQPAGALRVRLRAALVRARATTSSPTH